VKPPPVRVAEIAALTGLRTWLAWWVAIYHLTIPELAPLPPDGWLEPLRANGYLAVDGFFVLSGFILSYVYRDAFAAAAPGTYPRFLIARLARIYPLHLAMTLLVLALLGAMVLGTGFQPRVAERFSMRELLLHLGLLHGWGFSRMLAWNYPSWSISAEWFAYLCFPLVHRFVLRGESRPRAVAIAALALAGLAAFEQFGPNRSLSYTFEFALVRIGFEFVIGAALLMLARAWLEDPRARHDGPARPHATLALLAALASVFVLPDAATVGLIALAILFLSHPRDWLARPLGTPVMVYGGETSYAVYMTHAVIQGVAIIVVRAASPLGMVPGWVRLLVLMLLVQAAASLAHAVIEKPGRAWVRRVGETLLLRRRAVGEGA
jgi:peptidoglycan/LPS O-acetylase OafA/YrhL